MLYIKLQLNNKFVKYLDKGVVFSILFGTTLGVVFQYLINHYQLKLSYLDYFSPRVIMPLHLLSVALS